MSCMRTLQVRVNVADMPFEMLVSESDTKLRVYATSDISPHELMIPPVLVKMSSLMQECSHPHATECSVIHYLPKEDVSNYTSPRAEPNTTADSPAQAETTPTLGNQAETHAEEIEDTFATLDDQADVEHQDDMDESDVRPPPNKKFKTTAGQLDVFRKADTIVETASGRVWTITALLGEHIRVTSHRVDKKSGKPMKAVDQLVWECSKIQPPMYEHRACQPQCVPTPTPVTGTQQTGSDAHNEPADAAGQVARELDSETAPAATAAPSSGITTQEVHSDTAQTNTMFMVPEPKEPEWVPPGPHDTEGRWEVNTDTVLHPWHCIRRTSGVIS